MTKKKKRTRMIAAVLLLAVLAVTYVLVLRADFNGEDVEEETEEIKWRRTSQARAKDGVSYDHNRSYEQ